MSVKDNSDFWIELLRSETLGNFACQTMSGPGSASKEQPYPHGTYNMATKLVSENTQGCSPGSRETDSSAACSKLEGTTEVRTMMH